MKNKKVRVWAPKLELKVGGKTNWKGRGDQEININILDELKKVGEVPTIRGVWYILVSKFPKEIPNTKTIYQSYDKITVSCRDGEIGYPTIAVDAFAALRLIAISLHLVPMSQMSLYKMLKMQD